MRLRVWIWLLACLLCVGGAWLMWRPAANPRTHLSVSSPAAAPKPAAVAGAVLAARILTPGYTNSAKAGTVFASSDPFALRVSNTKKTIGQLAGDRHAVLLANALIDTGGPLDFSLPVHLRSPGDPGAYIVQARGPIDAAFRAMLAAAGAEIVSYIPNDAYLVRATAGVAGGLAANPLTQAVISYEPYYKIQSSLLTPAMGQMRLPDGASLNLGLFPNAAPTTIAQIEQLGGKIVSQTTSPFGPVVQVIPPQNWTELATLAGVQIVEAYHPRIHANDLSRVATGVTADTLATTNYMNLTGSNVMVEVNDSGIDATHPDFGTGGGLPVRVVGNPANLVDTDGHGTHVAGIIAGDGTESTTVQEVQGSIVPGTGNQFRGMAPLANLLSMNQFDSDQDLQMAAAETNALISNNSWNYGVAAYDLAAASYDAAVRDALPGVTGSQPVLFVFSAGNNGGGDDSTDPGGGFSDTILSPGTAKNVITVGALQEFRDITNIVTTISADGTTNLAPVWEPQTSTSYRVAGFSSRGNVGIDLEGTYGRFKPDVVAPGTFVVSTRSAQWDIARAFYINPTNHDVHSFTDIVTQPGDLFANVFQIVPANAVQTAIYVLPNPRSPFPFPDLVTYFSLATSPAYTFSTANNQVLIPPDGGLTIADIRNSESFWGFNYAVSNNTAQPIGYDVFTDLVTTNNPGDYFLVLSNLDQSIGTANPTSTGPGPYYRYESGTSMSAADVSGVLALMQDYFTNTLGYRPSPALLKAMVINGARASSTYNFYPQNAINYEGWGVLNLSNSLPAGVTTNPAAAGGESMLLLDQDPKTALATGDTHTYQVLITGTNAQTLPLRITLAWTDPPGDPAAAIKLVNDLNLIVTNMDDPAHPLVYYGNDIAASSTFNSAESISNAPVYDAINNVENVYLQPGSGTNFTVIVQGFRVNVNAVTAQTNTASGAYGPNVVQDYALVISSGNGTVTNAFTVTDTGPGLGIASNPTGFQQITGVTNYNVPLLNQLVGASTPLLGTGQVPLGTNQWWGGTNALVTIGMTNQWHFFIVTNTSGFTNAAFVTFIPDTLSIPRMGVFAGSVGNATQPEADIDLYVTTDPALMNLDPAAISNCVHGAQVGATAGGIFQGASLSRGGTEYVVDTNSIASTNNPEVYYVGVYAEDQEASEFGFIPIFSEQPFSQINPDGSQTVNGVPLPVNIPDGSPARPGHGYVFGIALYSMQVLQVVATNTVQHQHFDDLIGTLTHGSGNGLSQTVVLNNHVSLNYPSEIYGFVYDDSGFGNVPGSQPTSGPGSLNTYVGDQGSGVWRLTETDDSLFQVGSEIGFNMLIQPHNDLTKGLYGTVGPLGWFYDFVDVPVGVTSLTISATNLTFPPSLSPPLNLYVKYGSIPTLTDTNEFGPAGLTNGIPPGNSLTINAPAPGRYWVGLYNGSVLPQAFYLIADLAVGTVPGESIYTSRGAVPLLDDAVTTDTILVPANQTISSMEVGLRVDHPRVSDLVFHLISPSGTRVLLVENRGANTTEGMGSTITITNVVPVSSSGGPGTSSSVINLATATGTLSIFYNFYTQPDELAVYDQGGALIFDSGLISGSGVFNVAYAGSSFVTIVMNPFGNPGDSGDLWDYTVDALQGKQSYLVLTEDTNKTTTPIKFAPPPFAPSIPVTINPPAWHGSFEGGLGATITAGSYFGGGWLVESGSINLISPPSYSLNSTGDEGTNWIDLDGDAPNTVGVISTNIPTMAGQNYTLTFTYAQNADGKLFGHPTALMQVLADTNSLLNLSVTQTNGWLNLGWTTTNVVFTATSNSTKITFHSLDPSGDIYGVLLDCIDLTSSDLNDGFENTIAGNYVRATNTAGATPGFGSWAVLTNQVTVISNASLAYGGSTNLLALAAGQIYRALPTTPGTTYTLSFAYRGPDIVGLWRGESNSVALDSIYGNNGSLESVTFANGEVGQALHFTGFRPEVSVPDQPIFQLTNSLSIEGWIHPTGAGDTIFWRGDQRAGYDPYFLQMNGDNTLGFIIEDATSAGTVLNTPTPVVYNNWYHVAATLDGITGIMSIYVNGALIAQTNTAIRPFGPLITADEPTIGIGNVGTHNFFTIPFNGDIDEISLYGRALSASEIKAIYNLGTNVTKFDTNATSVATGLAEAQVVLNGTNQPSFFGDNTNWQTLSYTFTATATNTPLQINGLEPGMLLDQFVMTSIPTNNYDLYYLPEQSLDTVKGENALGPWQLEVQDARAGATNPTPSLVSWQLRFNFPYTPPTITTLTNTQVITNNLIPPGGIEFYLVIVPTNADISTNILLNGTGPLNLLFDQPNPPTSLVPPDYLILSAPTAPPNSSAVLTLTSAPTNFAAGGTYYLGVQNLNAFAVNYDIQVFFHLVSPLLTLPPLPEQLAIVGQLFTVTNAASGGVPPYTYTLTSSVTTGPTPSIDVNGVITWTPDATQAPLVYTFTNIVTDSPVLPTQPQFATNIFHVLVLSTTNQPPFPNAAGAGARAIGGRGGDVYHVVNVNDDGPGSLRFGIQSTFGSRTIVFDVSGTIQLYSPLKITNPYFTIAGQTAPGDGITLQGLTFSAETVSGALDSAHDEILRFLRCRPGDLYAQYYKSDSFHFLGAKNSIADHLSASWSIDSVLSTMLSTNITVQWSMIAQPLDHSAYSTNNNSSFEAHGNGSLIRYGSGAISYLHNLYADNSSQSPRVGDNLRLEFVNNVVCNWGGAAGTNADDAADNTGGYTNLLNYRGNYFIAGSNSANPSIAFASGVPDPTFTQIYEATNLIDNNPFTNFLDGLDNGFGIFSGAYTPLGSPVPMPGGAAGTNSPELAYEQVLAFAGASVAGATAAGTPAAGTSLLRDPVDSNIVVHVRNKSGQIIDFISSNSFAGAYLHTNFGVTWSGYPAAATYWVTNSPSFTNFVGVNPWPVLASAPQPLDSDGDGLPDYWEITLLAAGELGMNPAVPNNNHGNPDGYTDLEHYLNWLAVPHALTVSNTPVDVDLYAMVGRTGNLSFGLTNGTNGTVTLGTDGHTATFMPTNDYFGFASFGFTVTNLDTGLGGTNLDNGFGVTVSVMVSLTNITTSSTLLTNAVPQTNAVAAGNIVYYLIDVPFNAQLATNILSAASGPLNLIFSRAGFPSGTNTGDYFLLTNSTGGISLLSTASTPTNIVPGGSYYLGVQNLGGAAVTFGLEVDFYPPPGMAAPPVSPIVITSITATNHGYLVQWQGPTNDQYAVQWTTNLAPLVSWLTVLNPVINVTLTATNGHYSWFDDGSLTDGMLDPMKFYQVLGSPDLGPITGSGPATNTVLPGAISQAVVEVPANATLASNLLLAATGPLNVWFNPTNPPTGNVSAGDVLMLSASTAGTFVLTGSSVPPLVPGTNYFLGFQNPGAASVTFAFQVVFGFTPVSAVSNLTVTATNGGYWLRWNGLTNYQYQLQWTANLAPPSAWNTVSNIVLTSTTGLFSFFDDGSLTGGLGPMKYYRLIAYPYLTPIPQTLAISSVTVTNLGGTNDLVLRWSAPTNYQYGIQWTTNVALPFSNWTVMLSPVLTQTNGVYTFIDNGQTGPSLGAKFFRLLEY